MCSRRVYRVNFVGRRRGKFICCRRDQECRESVGRIRRSVRRLSRSDRIQVLDGTLNCCRCGQRSGRRVCREASRFSRLLLSRRCLKFASAQ